MGILVQTSPLSDNIVYDGDLNGDYVNQLNIEKIVGGSTLIFLTLEPNPSLLVNSAGVVTTTGYLPLGSYTVSGSVSDGTYGNTGLWTFTLTVTLGASPQTNITPTSPALPSGVEILVPFQIDPATGSIAYTSNYGQIYAQHIADVVMTNFGERLMMPMYGSALDNAVFTPIVPVATAQLAQDIKKSINKWVQGVQILDVSISNNDQQAPSVLNVTVEFTVLPFKDVNKITLSNGGSILQVSSR